MKEPWFHIDRIDARTYCISEYRHWEETHCYVLIGHKRSLLIDTGLGIQAIDDIVHRLTANPITAVPTHIHWDHIGNLAQFPDFYTHEAELPWLQGAFPLSLDTLRHNITDHCDLPDDFKIEDVRLFQGMPTKLLKDNDRIDLGDRCVQVLHTPGHSPGHLCFWEAETGYLFTGDLVYQGTLYASYPSTDPIAYLHSLERLAQLPAARIFPAHHSLAIQPEIIQRMRDEFQKLFQAGMLHHSSGTFTFEDWALAL